MGKLFEVLTNFVNEVNSNVEIEKLEDKFNELARVFLYGGYIKVRDDYRIYIRTVEFYFHSEKENGIHDPIVYHRNGKGLKKVPYFPLMTLHSHDSGYDVTFEKEQEYRASVLIRSYEVVDNNGHYLEWNKKDMFEEQSSYKFNTQSLYLRKLLNGFSICGENGIKWVDESRKQTSQLLIKARERVYQIDADGKKVKCTRKWSFTRKEQV